MSKSSQSKELALLDKARKALSEADSLDDVKTVRDKAEAVRSYAKAAKLGLMMHNHAAEIKLRAERRAGEMLASLRLRGGDRKSKSQASTLKLDELGVTRDESYRWQKEAEVPEEDFEKFLKSTTSLGQEVTAAGLLRLAKKSQSSSKNKPTSAAPSKNTNRDLIYDWTNSRRLGNIRELCGHLELLENLLEMVIDGCADQLKPIERRTMIRLFAEMKELAASIEQELVNTK